MRVAKKINIYRYSFISILLVCLAFVCSAFFMTSTTAKAAETTVEYKTVHVGDVIAAEDYTLSGGQKAESLTVVRPSGGLYGGQSFVVEQAGMYEVTYHATSGDSHVEEQRTYLAIRRPKDMISPDGGVSVEYGKYEVESPYELKKDTYGALVSVKAGSSIIFNANIKTEKLTADYNIFDLIVMPAVFKETDFEKLTVYVTDSENPDNYVQVVILSASLMDGDGQVSYVRAGANGQQIGGYEGSTYHTANYGTQVEHSFRAFGRKGEFRDNHTISENSLTLAIDNSSKKVYCGPANNETTDNSLVNDLDDAAHYKGNPWGGFTSDEVTVEIVVGGFTKASGTVLVKSFGDYDFAKDLRDTEAPEIELEFDETQDLPFITVGKEFPIIPFTAKDALDAQIKTNVYVYYLAPNGQRINVSNDGDSFVASYEGEYEIVYYAEDYSGNSDEKVIRLTALSKAPGIFLSIDEAEISAEVYHTVAIKEAEEVHAFGGNGALSVERTVYTPSKKILEVEDTLQLTEIGDYKVVYKVTDYLQNVEYGIVTVHSLATSAPTFTEEPEFNKVLIKGFTYALPQPFVIESVDDSVVELTCKTYVNGSLATDSFVADGSSVDIKYVAEGETGTSEWTTTLSVVDTENGKYQSKYFYAEGNVSAIDEKDYLHLLAEGDGSFEFVKELYSQGFSFAFTYEAGAVHFNEMAVRLTDAEDKNLVVTFLFSYDEAADAWFLQLNGKGAKVSYTVSKNTFSFARMEDGIGIKDTSGGIVANIQSYDNGEPFHGFSNAVYFHMEFSGVSAPSSIYLTNLCNQVMGYKKSSIDKAKDEIKPVIFLSEEFQIRQKLGTLAKIPTAVAYDVLGQIREFTVTVKTAKGDFIGSGSASEPLEVLLEEAGNYLVSYYAKDSNGKFTEISYLMFVADETAPTLSLSGSLKKEYTVGDKITLPTYSATDNSDKCYIQVEVILPDNELRLLHYTVNGEVTSLLTPENKLYNDSFKVDENTFVVEKTGVYILRLVAYDEYYNCTVREFEFKVK